MTTNHLYNKVIGLAIAALTFAACSDTWDDHNNRAAEGVEEGSLWQAIQQNPELSNFSSPVEIGRASCRERVSSSVDLGGRRIIRSEEHTSELQSRAQISYAVFCLKKKICHAGSIRAFP